MRLSKRSKLMPDSPIRKLVPYADAAKKAGKTVYHINIGQPDIPTPPLVMDAILSYKEKNLPYGPSKGLLTLREEMCRYYSKLNLSLAPEEISITEGASEAILFTYSCITDPGDEVLVFEPFYANYNGFAATQSTIFVPITLKAENGYDLPSREHIQAKISPRTRAIQICSPNNPNGKILTRKEMELLVSLALEHDMFIISDEVYREFAYDGKKALSILEFEEIHQQAVVIDSISKQFSACGARIGAMISKNTELLERALKYGQMRLCPPILGQIGAQAAYSMDPSDFEPVRKEYQLRRDTVVEMLQGAEGISCSVPDGTFYLMVKLSVDNSEEFAKFLLTDFEINGETIMVAPGPGFYSTPGLGYDEIRIAFVIEIDKLKKALEILKQGLLAYNRRTTTNSPEAEAAQ